jgi:hypothetical protein
MLKVGQSVGGDCSAAIADVAMSEYICFPTVSNDCAEKRNPGPLEHTENPVGLRQYTKTSISWFSAHARRLPALTPLIWEHVNPDGRFDLHRSTRLALL